MENDNGVLKYRLGRLGVIFSHSGERAGKANTASL